MKAKTDERCVIPDREFKITSTKTEIVFSQYEVSEMEEAVGYDKSTSVTPVGDEARVLDFAIFQAREMPDVEYHLPATWTAEYTLRGGKRDGTITVVQYYYKKEA